MRFQLAGAPEIAAPVERVWERLLDAEFVASCAPAVEWVEQLDDTHFKVVSGLGVGSVKLQFALAVELHDLQRSNSARMSVHGKAPGSEMHAETGVELESLGPARTRLRWTVSADVHGKVASVGARLLKSTAKQLTEGFWKRFARRVAQRPDQVARGPKRTDPG